MIKAKGSNPIAFILAIRNGGVNKKKKFSHPKGRAKVGHSNKGLKRKTNSEIAPNTDPKEAICFTTNKRSPET